jgi:hypothetical protein
MINIKDYDIPIDQEGKKVNPIFSSPTIKYADPSICSYISYHCEYCGKPFPLVDHTNDYQSGGALLKQVLEKDNTGKTIKVGKIRPVCLSCSKEIMNRNRTRYFSW